MASNDKELEKMRKELEELKAERSEEKGGNELLQFFIGFLLFGAKYGNGEEYVGSREER